MLFGGRKRKNTGKHYSIRSLLHAGHSDVIVGTSRIVSMPSVMTFESKVAQYGAEKYGETRLDRNYTKIPVDEHANHALQHILLSLPEIKAMITFLTRFCAVCLCMNARKLPMKKTLNASIPGGDFTLLAADLS